MKCAYCGEPAMRTEKEHVFPACLYPKATLQASKVQRLTIPACRGCNGSWSDDEPHFRNVIVLTGDPPSPERTHLFESTVSRSFDEVDGFRRMSDLVALVRDSRDLDGQLRIYPGSDPRVVRVAKKIIRGLCFHHDLDWPVEESRVQIRVLGVGSPLPIVPGMEYYHRDPRVAEYWLGAPVTTMKSSIWLVRILGSFVFGSIVEAH